MRYSAAMHNDALLKDLATCGSPDTLIAAIMRHNPDWQAPVDVQAFAQTVGIAALRDLESEGFTSGLMADIDKAKGIILTRPTLASPRRRIAIAHQLGHFLMKGHHGDRQCTGRDLSEHRRDTPRRKEEMQANRFAAGLLMPKPWFVTLLQQLGKPTVAHLPKIGTTYGVTLEAAADRYVELSGGLYTLLLIKNNVIGHVASARAFPALTVHVGDAAPAPMRAAAATDPVAWTSANVRDWLVLSRDMRPPSMTMQLLGLKNGLQIVMLFINAAAEKRADDEAEKFATERPKFGRPSSR